MFSKYLQANYRKRDKKTELDIYTTYCLKNINDAVANFMGGSVMKVSYESLINPKEEETRTADEIIQDIGKRLDAIGAQNGCTELEGSADA